MKEKTNHSKRKTIKKRQARFTKKDELALQRKQTELRRRRQRVMAALLDRLILWRLGGAFHWEVFQEALPDIRASGTDYSTWVERYLTKRFARGDLNEWLHRPLKEADIHFAEILLSLLLSEGLRSARSPFFNLEQGSGLMIHLAEQMKLDPREVWEALRSCLEISVADFLGRLRDCVLERSKPVG